VACRQTAENDRRLPDLRPKPDLSSHHRDVEMINLLDRGPNGWVRPARQASLTPPVTVMSGSILAKTEQASGTGGKATWVRIESLRALFALIFVLAVLSGSVSLAGSGAGQPAPARAPARAAPVLPRPVANAEKADHVHQHLPNEGQHRQGDDMASILFNSFLQAVIGVTVLVILGPFISRLVKMLARQSGRENASAQQVISPDDYTGEDGSCTLEVPRKKRLPPRLHVVRSRESYFLKVEHVDSRSGIAGGWLACKAHGNDAGEWALTPVDGRPNARLLRFQIKDQPPIETILVRNN
jgi:hypothetical protein